MDDVERASLIRVGIDPDGDPVEVAEQVRVSDYLASTRYGYATGAHGRLTDLFTTLRLRNIAVLLAAGLQNLALVGYLIGQLLSTRHRKFAQLQRFYPTADPDDWYLVQAGQRAQLVKPDPDRVGVLTFGTELVTGAEGTIAGLLGASPGASTAPAIMLDLLTRCFSHEKTQWEPMLHKMMPAMTAPVGIDQQRVDDNLAWTGQALGLV